ncbi:MAG TPA: nuclear transport factor 2 family protein [Acidimicrobiales bacterium]|nr:nuclear transport factor 2 family protein [Acidimicrobiales bacterium]
MVDGREQLDRDAIKAVVDAYAAGVDALDAAGVAALFAEAGVLAVPDPTGAERWIEIEGPAAIESRLEGLRRYRATIHDVANHRAEVQDATATAVTSCFAHHLEGEDGDVTDRTMAIRYYDWLERSDAGWRFVRRELHLLWTQRRAVEA